MFDESLNEHFYLFNTENGKIIGYLHDKHSITLTNAVEVTKEDYLEAGGVLNDFSSSNDELRESIDILLGGRDNDLDAIIGG